jgi:ABC-type uncharacterized transport system permease subunit
VRALSFASESLRLAAPYAACALGAVVGERSGLVNVAFEGALLVSGFCAVVAAERTGSAWPGLLAAVAAGAAFCGAHGLVVVRGRVDAIVSGVALNLVAYGLTRTFLRLLYESASNSPPVAPLLWPGLDARGGLAGVLADPAVAALAAAALALPFWLRGSRLGLRIRASGEGPEAARALGVDVGRARVWAAAISGALAGLGGAHLVFDQRQFHAGMSGGRGFLALAAVIVGGWRVGPTLLACLGFAALEALQVALQDRSRLPPELAQMLPYVVTLAALGLFMKRRRPPAGLGLY